MKILIAAPLLFLACKDPKLAGFRENTILNQNVYLNELPSQTYIDSLDLIAQNEIVKTKDTGKKVNVKLSQNPLTKVAQTFAKKAQKTKILTPEEFAEKFIESLEKLSQDPSNKKLGKTIKVKSDIDALTLIQKFYGLNPNRIPKSVVDYSLSALNPNINLYDIKAGEEITLPKL
jgi:hypothetical protein